MGRRVKLVVAEDVPLREEEWYPLEAVHIDVKRREKQVVVELRHARGNQQGRTHVVALPLPIRRYGLAGDFLRACGSDVRPGVEIDAPECVGRMVEAKFHVSSEGEPTILAFKPIVQERTS